MACSLSSAISKGPLLFVCVFVCLLLKQIKSNYNTCNSPTLIFRPHPDLHLFGINDLSGYARDMLKHSKFSRVCTCYNVKQTFVHFVFVLSKDFYVRDMNEKCDSIHLARSRRAIIEIIAR